MTKARSVFLFWARLTLVFVFLVIAAGSIVRATGSGMGCPDWPKCFGHYIPPTQLEQLEYQPGREFKKGQFIIHQRALWKARQTFTAGSSIDMSNWEKYTKHDYARFNPAHTWTEYINRLSGALLGIVSFITLILSLRVLREDLAIPLLSFLAVFLIGFEAWLGATVVESNLDAAKITTHMVGAVVIVAVVLEMIRRGRSGQDASRVAPAPRGIRFLALAAIGATVIQIIMGTQVREAVDVLDKTWNGEGRGQWIEQIGSEFQIHRVFAYALLLLNAFLVYRLRRYPAQWQQAKKFAYPLMLLLVVEWFTGVALALFGIPAFIQPVHLVVATIIIALQIRIWHELRPQLLVAGQRLTTASDSGTLLEQTEA